MEEWRPILGWEGLYEVSNRGRIRSCERIVKRRGQGDLLVSKKIRLQNKRPDGYMSVNLFKDGKGRGVYVHRAVIEAFTGQEISKGLVVNHKNGNRNDNRLENLEVISASENSQHAVDILKKKGGGRNIRIISNGEQEFSSYNDIANFLESKGMYEGDYKKFRKAIIRSCESKAGMYKGYKWFYIRQLTSREYFDENNVENGEEFRDIKGFEGSYKISNFGRVISYCKKKPYFMSPVLQGNGYVKVQLHKNNEFKNFRVHRLVAEHFIPNPDNKPYVNHVDGNKSNNVISNLEWSDESENSLHSVRILKNTNNDYHKANLCLYNGERMFSTYKEAFDYLNETRTVKNIKDIKNLRDRIYTSIGKNQKAYGYYWSRHDDLDI